MKKVNPAPREHNPHSTAQVLLDQAIVRAESAGGRDHYTIETSSKQRFSLKTAPGSKVINGEVVAELLDDSLF